jgi:hypothetical protein
MAENTPGASAPITKPDFTLRVKKSRNSDEFIEIGLRDIDEATFLAANSFMKKDKELEAVKYLIRQLRVSGAKPEEICDNFHAVRAAVLPLMELIRPLEGELKKN